MTEDQIKTRIYKVKLRNDLKKIIICGYDGRIGVKSIIKSHMSYQRIKLESGLVYKAQQLKSNNNIPGMLFQLNSNDFLNQNKNNKNMIVTGGSEGVLNFWDVSEKIKTIDLHLDGKFIYRFV